MSKEKSKQDCLDVFEKLDEFERILLCAYSKTESLIELKHEEIRILEGLQMEISRGLGLRGDIRNDSKKIEELNFSKRTLRCLYRINTDFYGYRIRTVADIINFPKIYWTKVRMLGKVASKEIEEKMHQEGYPDFTIPL